MPMPTFTPGLTFVGEQLGRADEAMEVYVAMFPKSRVIRRERSGPGEDEPEGALKQARLSLNGQELRARDSGRERHFTVAPAMSVFVDCESDEEIERYVRALSGGGEVLMASDAYLFSKRFGWVNDRFGMSWQLNLPH
jgi:predicted 3-demethylubiquinone-9 3-methyltransferase (glyoxalase superfamily)